MVPGGRSVGGLPTGDPRPVRKLRDRRDRTGAGGSAFTAPGSGPGVRVARVTPRKDTHSQIRTLPIFAGCTEAELDEIDRLADEVHISAGRTLMRQGDLVVRRRNSKVG